MKNFLTGFILIILLGIVGFFGINYVFAIEPELEIAVLTVDEVDEDSVEVYWKATSAAGQGEYRYSTSESGLDSESWSDSGVVNGPETGNIFASKVTIDGLTTGQTYYVDVRKWYSQEPRLYGETKITSFTINDEIEISQPTVSDLSSTGVTIEYSVANAGLSNPTFCYGLNTQWSGSDCISWPIADPGDPFVVNAALTDLEPDTSYFYQLILDKDVEGKELIDSIYSFTTMAAQAEECTDSDNGKDYYTKGTTFGLRYSDSDAMDTETDVCTVAGKYLIEYSCSNDVRIGFQYECPNGCEQGVCKSDDDENNDDDSDDEDELTPSEEKLLERIRHLEYRISELEREVVENEKTLAQVVDQALTNRLKGRILLQVEGNGEAWYVDEDTEKKFYLKDGESAYIALNAFGLGISNDNIAKIPIGIEDRAEIADTDGDGLDDKLEEVLGTDINNTDTDGDGHSDGDEVKSGYSPTGPGALAINTQLADELKGKILLQVESRGEAWYINPVDGKRYYMKDGAQAYQIMRFLSLGISNDDLRKIAVGEFE